MVFVMAISIHYVAKARKYKINTMFYYRGNYGIIFFNFPGNKKAQMEKSVLKVKINNCAFPYIFYSGL